MDEVFGLEPHAISPRVMQSCVAKIPFVPFEDVLNIVEGQ